MINFFLTILDLKKEAFDITFKKLKLKAEKSKARIKRREAKMALKKKNRSLVSDSSDSSKSSESDTSTDSEAMSKSDITEKKIKVEREDREREDLEEKKKTSKRRSRSKDRNGRCEISNSIYMLKRLNFHLLSGMSDSQRYPLNQCLGSGSVGSARFWLPGSGSAKICGSADPNPRGSISTKCKTNFTLKTQI